MKTIQNASAGNSGPLQLLIPNRLIAIAAPDQQVHPLVIHSLGRQAERGESIGVIVGHNRFDLYALARSVRDRGFDPARLLVRIRLSRAFTCHQLHHCLLTLDRQVTCEWRALYVLGLLDTFYDESVEPREALYLLHSSLAHLTRLARGGLPVLLTLSAPGKPGREHLTQSVARTADAYWEIENVPHLTAIRQLAMPLGV